MRGEQAKAILADAVPVTHQMGRGLEESGSDAEVGPRDVVVEESDHAFLGDVFGDVRISREALAIAYQGGVVLIEGRVEVHVSRRPW